VRGAVVLRLSSAASRAPPDCRMALRFAVDCWLAPRAVDGPAAAAGRLADGLRLPASVRADGACRSDGLPDRAGAGRSAGRPGGVAARRAADCHGARDPADAQAGMSAGAFCSCAATGPACREVVAPRWARSGAASAGAVAAGATSATGGLGSSVAESDISPADQVWLVSLPLDTVRGTRWPAVARRPAAARRAAVRRGCRGVSRTADDEYACAGGVGGTPGITGAGATGSGGAGLGIRRAWSP
jgi:hypothetical protein